MRFSTRSILRLALVALVLPLLPAPAVALVDPLGLEVQVPVASAYEAEGIPALFTISRSPTGPLDEITVHFALAGDDDPSAGTASADDFTLTDGSGGTIASSVLFPAGATSIDLVVRPLADGLAEVPETLRLILLDDPAYAIGATAEGIARIHDATNVSQNERPLLAFLAAEDGAQTFGSGIGIVRLQGDNAQALVDLSFSGLTTPQSAVHIHVSNPSSGPPIESLPLGQVTDHTWTIRAAQFLTTDQQVLDALLGGQLYVNVHSQKYPTGEIRGQFGIHAASTELHIPPAPPPLPALTGTDLDRDIVRFLTQATFGPTPALFDEVQALIQQNGGDRIAAMSAWLDGQMDAAQTPLGTLLEFTRASGPLFRDDQRDRRSGWWLFTQYGHNQLRQRLAFALSEILVVSDADSRIGGLHLAASDYYDTLLRGAFGSYRDLLLNVTLHPIMGHYLSHLRNQKTRVDAQGQVITSPDENYAREIMQLFTFGLVRLHLDGSIVLGAKGLPIATYDNAVITEMARVLTGLSFSKRYSDGEVVDNSRFLLGLGGAANQTRWLHPMKMFQAYHDEGPKTIFGGHVLPAGQDGMVDVGMMHDLLVGQPTTAPFLSRLLIQRLVTSNPSRGYVYRVAKRLQQTDGNLGEVVKAILLDYEARSLDVIADVGYGKVKEPLLRLTALLRLFDGRSQVPLAVLAAQGYPQSEAALFPADATIFRLRNVLRIGQRALSSPTVFNFFSPDFTKPGDLGNAGLAAPELQIFTESQHSEFLNYIYDLVFRANGLPGDGVPPDFPATADDIALDLSVLQRIHDDELASGSVQSASEAVVDYLDLYLNCGGLRHRYAGVPAPTPRSILLESVASTAAAERIKTAVYLLAGSPQGAVQR